MDCVCNIMCRGARSVAKNFAKSKLSINPRLLAKADIHLIVQSPSTEAAYRTQIESIIRLSREYDKNDVTMMVIIVGAVEHRCVDSSKFQTQAMFEQALTTTVYLGHCTQVSVALKVARENYMSSYDGRPGVKKLAMILNVASDCGEETSAVDEANKIKLMVSVVVVVSVGAGNRTFLDRLTSKSDNVLTFSSDLELIDNGTQQIKEMTCRIAPKHNICADIGLMIDASESIGHDDFTKLLIFIVGLTEYFNIGADSVQFAAMLFGSSVQTLFNLQVASHATIRQKLLEAPYLAGSTNTAAALVEVRTRVFSVSTRPSCQKIVIVITDGGSDRREDTEQAAEALKDSGVRVIAIGVGRANVEELNVIASTPGDVFYVDTFDVLQTIFEKIVELTSKPTVTTLSVNPKLKSKADIHLIVQSPSTEAAFRSKMEFVVKLCREYDRNDVSLGVIVVGKVKHSYVDSSNFQEQTMFEQALINTAYLGHCKGASKALKMARKNYIRSYGGRPGVKKLAMILNVASDCGDETSAVDEANKIKLMVSEVVVVSVGAGNRTFLDRLTSKSDNVLTFSSDLELIDGAIGQIKIITASVAPKYAPVADILFVIDSSGSIGDVNYAKVLNFIVVLTEYFNIGLTAVLFSAMLFSDSTQMLFTLDTQTHASIKQTVLAAPYLSGGTNTAVALREAGQALTIGARNTKKIVIVITDGQSNVPAETSTAAVTLRNSGVRVIAIGVGSANQEELKVIASAPDDVYYVDTFDVLQTIYDKIAEMTSS
ncbi:collagen alpha-5(VI) chain-like [Physella acuta]|uniref:collagen alpha-5(VI) chain-like n=1 Tax=Physella acuta TaxID=109671 RepID=UPI0027DBEEBC|nr:collagen alpha-5(VI) chain-like [Physella acuta]